MPLSLLLMVIFFILSGCDIGGPPDVIFYTLAMELEGEGTVVPPIVQYEYERGSVVLEVTPEDGGYFI